MDYITQQKQFDTMKWFDSVKAGEDQCGSYPFCINCNKDEENPCARAMEKQTGKRIRIALILRRA